MKKIFLTIILMTSWFSVIYAETNIKTIKKINKTQSIGIIPFVWDIYEISSECISQIIMHDLQNSGKFNPLNILQLPQKPKFIHEIKPELWEQLGIYTLIIGKVNVNKNHHYTITYKLITYVHRNIEIIEQKKIKVVKSKLRWAAHTISDNIFKKLTGIQGIFCTRIAYIIYSKNEQPQYELRISDYDGYNSILIYRSLQPLMSPAWSPDGSKLAYVTFDKGHATLVLQTLNNGHIFQISNYPQHNGSPAFSPDGKKLAFTSSKTGSLHLYIFDLESEYIRKITYGRHNNTEPSWFPDSKVLVYTSDQSGGPQLYKINIDHSIPQRLSWNDIYNQNADVSPDGHFLVMVNRNNNQQHIAKFDLIMDNVHILTNTYLDKTPSIAPNGKMLVYSSISEELGSIVKIISIDGKFTLYLPFTNEIIKFPTWSPYL